MEESESLVDTEATVTPSRPRRRRAAGDTEEEQVESEDHLTQAVADVDASQQQDVTVCCCSSVLRLSFVCVVFCGRKSVY